ncbi:MAG: class I SAM-dependent methyltransferase [Elusimicrobiota bacterium]
MNRKQFFDRHAEKWDNFITKDIIRRIEKDLLPLFKIKKAEYILDVGSGTGILLPFLKKSAGKKGKVAALDYSAPMLEKAKAKYGDAFEYICADAGETPFDDALFDIVICFAVFPHFPNKLKVLKELFRILKPRGNLIIAHTDVRETINSFHRKVGVPVAQDHMPDDEKMISLLKKAGFNNNTIEEGKDYYIAYGYK